MANHRFEGFVDQDKWASSIRVQAEHRDGGPVHVKVYHDTELVVDEKLPPGDAIDRRVRQGDTVTIEGGICVFTVDFFTHVDDLRVRRVTVSGPRVNGVAVADNKNGQAPVVIITGGKSYVAEPKERAEVIVTGGEVTIQAQTPTRYIASVTFSG
jgi:hypothetical protein